MNLSKLCKEKIDKMNNDVSSIALIDSLTGWRNNYSKSLFCPFAYLKTKFKSKPNLSSWADGLDFGLFMII